MMAASVYAAIAAITREFAGEGIAKAHLNSVDQYQYRSIDDVIARLGPLLATHRLCVLPTVVERTLDERHGLGEGLLMHVALRVAYTMVSAEDGSSHVVECYGEALDRRQGNRQGAVVCLQERNAAGLLHPRGQV